MRRSPLGLHLPDADQFTNSEIAAVYDLLPSLLLTMTYSQWDDDKGAAASVCQMVRDLGHADLYVRFHADPNPIVYSRRNDGPAAWARVCAYRMNQYYGALAAAGVRLHAILANEVDADYEGNLNEQQASDWYRAALTTYADLRPGDIVHVPAPTGAPETHRRYLQRYRDDGWVDQSFVIDGHGYDGDLENVINVCGEVFPNNRRAITETNDINDFGWPIALLDGGKADEIVYFILNWARGGVGRIQPPTPDDAAKQMSLMRFPDRYAQFKSTIRETTIDDGDGPGTDPPVTPEPEPIPPVVPDQSSIFAPEHFWTFQQIATASDSLVENVREHWTATCEQLQHAARSLRPELNDPVVLRAVELGMIGTFAVETGPLRDYRFTPVREAYWLDVQRGYEWAEEYRRTNRPSSQYFPFYGRGKVQRTWEEAYAAVGPQIAALWGADPNDPTFDLVTNRDNLLQRDMSAASDAIFFATTRALPTASYPDGYSLVEACVDRDYEWIRRLVQGGTAGLDHLTQVMDALDPPSAPPIEETVPQPVYNPHYPVIPQNRSFDCSETSLLFELRAHGRQTTDAWLETRMIADGIMTPEWGLSDATGKGLAAFGNHYYGGMTTPGYTFGEQSEDLGYRFRAFGTSGAPVSFDEIAGVADGSVGVMAGGRNWYHWSPIRFYDRGRDVFILANPAHGHLGVYQEMTRQQFAALGWFSYVVVTVVDVAKPNPLPPIETIPDTLETLKAKYQEMQAAYTEMQRQLADANRDLGYASVDIANALAVAPPKYMTSADLIDQFCTKIAAATRSVAVRSSVESIRAEAQNVRIVTNGDVIPAIESLRKLKP